MKNLQQMSSVFSQGISSSGHSSSMIVTMSYSKSAVKVESNLLEENLHGEVHAENGTSDGGLLGASEEPTSILVKMLQSYKEALANGDKATVTEIEAFLLSIEKEKKSLENKVTYLSQELSSEKDRILHINEDFENFRKKSERDHLSLSTNVHEKVVENLLPVLNNFEKAEAEVKIETEGEEKINNIYQTIHKQVINILGSLGVGAVETVHNPFDPLEVSLGESCYHMEDVRLPCNGKMDENNPADERLMVKEPCADSINGTTTDRLFRTSISSTDKCAKCPFTCNSNVAIPCSPKMGKCLDNALVIPGNVQETQEIESMSCCLTSLPDASAPVYNIIAMELSSFPMQAKTENLEVSLVDSSENRLDDFSSADMLSVKIKKEIPEEFNADEVDHLPLQEKLKMLITSSSSSAANCCSPKISKCLGHSSSAAIPGSLKVNKCLDSTLVIPSNMLETEGIESRSSCLTSPPDASAPDNNTIPMQLPSFPMQVKAECLEISLVDSSQNHLGDSSSADVLAIKVKKEILEEFYADELDHIPLQERLKMLITSRSSGLDCSQDLKYVKQIVPGTQECDPVDSLYIKRSGATLQQKRKKIVMKCRDSTKLEHAQCASERDPIDPVKASQFILRRKRKKTVTDSVETALEEDAPGLLQVLVENGVNVDEIKLYGDSEDVDGLDMFADEAEFSELETVISKLFLQSSTLLKLASIGQRKKGSKDKYCLACLVSLVEQTRYLQFRKWPVQWGWSRDLQSFIFVFEGHNRIVLERPEYGYATYFFELVFSLPISWQIKRLVTAMKLTGCSRATLIENKALLVGEDLTEGEARVLGEYGWVPNSGLGTMLRYCGRVVHDRKSEINNSASEWRSKIGRLLMNGYDGGSIVLPNPPKRGIEYGSDQNQLIKMEV